MDYKAAAVSLRAIATGLMALADAVDTDSPTASASQAPAASDSNAPEADAAPPSRKRTRTPDKPKATEVPEDPEAGAQEPNAQVDQDRDDYDLAQIQAMGRELLDAKKRSELRAILERFSLPILSSAKADQFAELGQALQEALATE